MNGHHSFSTQTLQTTTIIDNYIHHNTQILAYFDLHLGYTITSIQAQMKYIYREHFSPHKPHDITDSPQTPEIHVYIHY